MSLPARLLLALIWLYRRTFSPVLPVVLGPGCGCRFHPTCAVFAAESVRTHGAARGSWLALRRLLKCHPLHPGGFDPVPPARKRRPTCTAVFSLAAASKPDCPVAPVSDWRNRWSKTGATLVHGVGHTMGNAG